MNARISKKIVKRVYAKIDAINDDSKSDKEIVMGSGCFTQLEKRTFLRREAACQHMINSVIDELKREGKW